MRALILEYPHDRNCWAIETQYLFGEHLLIAPVLNAREDCGTMDVYLPSGVWYDFWTKEARQGGQWISIAVPPLDSMPIWVRDGGMLPWAEERERTWNSVGKICRVEAYGKRRPDQGHEWTCDMAEGPAITVTSEQGRWTCVGREDVEVVHHT